MKDGFWEKIVVVGSFLVLLFILLLRFHLAMTRFFDPDEYSHFHIIWHLLEGRVPFVDFEAGYLPIFYWLFLPIFWFGGENSATLLEARALNFSFFLFTVFFVYKIGERLFDRKVGSLAALFFTALPIIIDKSIEVRPDHLMVGLFLAAFFLLLSPSLTPRLAFLSGLLSGLAAAVSIKALFLIPLLLIMAALNTLKKVAYFVLGIALSLFFISLLLLKMGILGAAFEKIFLVTFKAGMVLPPPEPLQVLKPVSPPFYFYPNDAIYGLAGKSLPWAFNLFLWVLTALGALWVIAKTVKALKARQSFPKVSFVLLFFLLYLPPFFTILPALLQYFLPLAPFVAILAAAVVNYFVKKTSPLLCFLVLLIAALATYSGVRARLPWTNQEELETINFILENSKPEDPFFDMVGSYVFRPDGHPTFAADSYEGNPLPLIDTLKDRENKFVVFPRFDRFHWLTKEERRFIGENYFPTARENVLAVGKKFKLARGEEKSFEIFASGNYKVLLSGKGGKIFIDGKPFLANGVFHLSPGEHKISAPSSFEGGAILKYTVF